MGLQEKDIRISELAAELKRLRGELERATAWRDEWESAHQAKVEALAMAEARIAALEEENKAMLRVIKSLGGATLATLEEGGT